MSENGLGGQARGQNIGVDVRIALPRPRRFQVELASPDVRRHDLVLNLLPKREVRVRNAVEPPGEAGKGARVAIDGRTPEVLQQVVMDVYTVHGRPGGVDLVEIGEIVVDEVG